MTGFARDSGQAEGLDWVWELRSVNGRGLELRLKLPNGWDGIEPRLREAAQKRLQRGNVSATLTLKRDAAAGAARLVIDRAALDQALALAAELRARMPEAAPPRLDGLMALPGVLRAEVVAEDEALHEKRAGALAGAFDSALGALSAMRLAEGARLHAILSGRLDEMAALAAAAEAEAELQPAALRERMLASLGELLAAVPALPEDRIAQEVAILVGKADVREELDRLAAHIAAARALLAEGGAVGRRLDFLTQEFNREANTLCSKSASVALTAIGLKLKAAIEQFREQVQNIE
ncbi:MAG: YicC family protein [Alphaproteobacteria bacterium]|nr:YicC family protein [Alphaproteobacteria bacterium]